MKVQGLSFTNLGEPSLCLLGHTYIVLPSLALLPNLKVPTKDGVYMSVYCYTYYSLRKIAMMQGTHVLCIATKKTN